MSKTIGCRQCGGSFEIGLWDEEIYEKAAAVFVDAPAAIPHPTLCPLCRAQRRMAWRSELHLFKRKCDFSGSDIVTFYPPGSPGKVYRNDIWWSDRWDALEFGREFDFSRPFFEQFRDLMHTVPLMALSCTSNENSDYVNCASWNKNCYLIAGANYNEECYYGNYLNYCRSCVDNNFLAHCELCYQCVDCTRCYNLRYSYNSHGCSGSMFLYNCSGCQECFCSVNLVNKRHVYLNEALSKADYQARLSMLKLGSRSEIEQLQRFFEQHRLKFPYKYMMGERNQDVTGNAIHSSRDARDCFDVSELENCRYCTWLHKSKDCMDIYAWGFSAELCYECLEVGADSYRVLFSVTAYGSKDIYYCYMPVTCERCFGCVAVQRKRNCILNKQYSEAEYNKLCARIVGHMQETGEWGEFFPIWTSPLPYNTTIAQDYFPLQKEEAAAFGWRWHDFPELPPPAEAVNLPDNICDVNEEICGKPLICTKSGKRFIVTSPELKFYKEQQIPLPSACLSERHSERLSKRNPRQLWQRQCNCCCGFVTTSYPPYRPEIVYCEDCYLKEVY